MVGVSDSKEVWKHVAFLAVATAVAILLIEPTVEMVIKSVSPSLASKVGIA